MALGALIGAYQEDDSGGLRALLPLAGRTLLEYQVRCASAAGAAPVVAVVERVPQALQDAFERLRIDGISVFPVSDVQEAISRYEAGSMILLVGDGIAAPADLATQIAQDAEPVVVTVHDDEAHAMFERIDAESRWAGLAVVASGLLGSTAAILGDWDLQSTLLRRTIQEGALRLPVPESSGEPILAENEEDLAHFQQSLIAGSRGGRTDWASRYVLPLVEEFATTELLETRVRPLWLIWAALLLTLGSAIAFAEGWLWTGLALLAVSTPLDLVASRLATLRLAPLRSRVLSRRALWPASAIALLALGWWEWRHVSGWGAMVAAVGAIAFSEATRIEKRGLPMPGEIWLLSRRNAILAAIPFAIFSAWTAFLVFLAAYACVSFYYTQHARHLGVG